MSDQKDKTLSYHRAEYLIDNPASIKLASCVKEACDKLTTVSQRTISRGGGQYIRLASFKEDPNKSVYLHLTVDTPGERASVVPSIQPNTNEIRVATVKAPSGTEFMDGDAFVFIRGNDLCLCMTTVRLGAVRSFLQDFLLAANVRKDASKFDIHNALDVNKVALLERVGVKSIELKGNMYAESAQYIKRKAHVAGVLGMLTRHLRALLGSEHDVGQDGLKVNLSIDLDDRQKGKTLGYRRLQSLATDMIAHQTIGDDYAIHLRNGEKIGPKDITLRTNVRIDSVGKSVERDQAWTRLEEYYKSLVSNRRT